MKKLFLLIQLGVVTFNNYSHAQTDTVKTFNRKIPVSQLKIYDRSVQFISLKTQYPVIVDKKDIQSLSFHNGFKVVYKRSRALQLQSVIYNATVNLNNGGFFTAIVDSIDADSLFYHKINKTEVLKINVNEVQFITYTNSLSENFITPASIDAGKIETAKPVGKAVENRKNRASYIGGTIGYSNSWLAEPDYSMLDRYGRNGFMIGFNYEYQFSEKGGLILGLRYEQKGSVYKNDTLKTKFNLPYLTAPINYRAYLGRDNFKIFFDAGFYFGFLLAANYEIENSRAQTSNKVNLNSSQFNIKHVDFGTVMGIGFNIKKPLHLVSIGMQYNLGFVTVQSGDYYSYPDYYSFATLNRNVVFYVTYGFDRIGYKQQQNKIKSLQ